MCAGTVSSNDFKNGMTLEIDGAPWRVIGAALRPLPLATNFALCMLFPNPC